MNDKIKDLLKLIEENPELEILPMVATECVASDDFSYWAAEWGRAEVDEYYTSDERIYFKSDDYEELIDEYFDNLDANIKTDEGEYDEIAKEYVDNLKWIKAIVVHINSL